MPGGNQIAITLSLTGEQPTTGKAVLFDRAIASRVGRAVVRTLATWAFAALMIFIPLLHWVLVPLFLTVGAILGVVKFFDDTSLLSAEGTCPRCHEHRVFEGAGRFRPGRTVHCNGCGSQLAVHPAPTPMPG